MFEIIKLQRLLPTAKLPTRGTKDSAYYDLYAAEDAYLINGRIRLVTTGWNIEVPDFWFLDVRSRSGLAAKGVTLINSPGTIDPDYRGELKIILINLSGEAYKVQIGDRIAQCAVMPIQTCQFREVSKLSTTTRGDKGYGSTGR